MCHLTKVSVKDLCQLSHWSTLILSSFCCLLRNFKWGPDCVFNVTSSCSLFYHFLAFPKLLLILKKKNLILFVARSLCLVFRHLYTFDGYIGQYIVTQHTAAVTVFCACTCEDGQQILLIVMVPHFRKTVNSFNLLSTWCTLINNQYFYVSN